MSILSLLLTRGFKVQLAPAFLEREEQGAKAVGDLWISMNPVRFKSGPGFFVSA
jgi:hypothetical protein